MTAMPTGPQAALIRWLDGGPEPPARVQESTYQVCRREWWIVRTPEWITDQPAYRVTDAGRAALAAHDAAKTNPPRKGRPPVIDEAQRMISAMFPESLVVQIDVARGDAVSRSDWLRDAAREKLTRTPAA